MVATLGFVPAARPADDFHPFGILEARGGWSAGGVSDLRESVIFGARSVFRHDGSRVAPATTDAPELERLIGIIGRGEGARTSALGRNHTKEKHADEVGNTHQGKGVCILWQS